MKPPFEQAIVLDFESAWGRQVKLGFSCQTNEEYVRDPRFKAWGLSWKWLGSDDRPVWVKRKDLPAFFDSTDWSITAVVAQNAQFDVSVMSWIYDAHPAFIIDTLSMGRALRGVEVGNSLKKLAQAFGLPDKGDGLNPSENYLDALPPHVEKTLADYCCHDTWLCEQIFYKLGGFSYPTKELRLIDMTLKMYTQPQLELDGEMLRGAIVDERTKREGLLEKLGVEETELASNPKFAAVLETLGVPAPKKKSKTTGRETLALAKNDAMFQALLNGEREDIAALCEARLRVKSTTERTRAQRFLDISKRGALPVPLSYYGAVTGRWTACLVADTRVLVYDRHIGQCEKRIVDVLPDDLVWDGVEFVQHEGVQFSGYKEVMTYDGITGTPEHKVFIDDETTLSLSDAQRRGEKIMDAAKPDVGALEAARARLKRLRW